jgi:hypothetical protein
MKNSTLQYIKSWDIILQNVTSLIFLTRKIIALKITQYFHHFNAHHCLWLSPACGLHQPVAFTSPWPSPAL